MLKTLDAPTRRLYYLFLAAFTVFGMIFTVAGAALPQIIRTFNWSYTLIGVVLAASSVAYAISNFISGYLAHRIPPKTILIVGVLLGAVGMVLFVRWPSPWLNLLLNLLVGLCQGTIETMVNLEMIHIERNGQSRLMNLVHSTFCIGALAGPLALAWLLKIHYPMTTVFAIASGMLVVMAVLFAVVRFPNERRETAHVKEHGLRLLCQPLLLIIIALLFVYVGCEIGVSSWSAEYFVTVLGSSVSAGALVVALYWAGLLVGRVGLSFFYKGTRQEIVILVCAAASTVALLLLQLIPSLVACAAAIVLVGLGFSGIYPLAISVVGRYFRTGLGVGSVAAGGAIGSVLFPFVCALLSQTVGIKKGFLFFLGLDVLLIVLAIVLVSLVGRERRRTAH
jgi:fucose permease